MSFLSVNLLLSLNLVQYFEATNQGVSLNFSRSLCSYSSCLHWSCSVNRVLLSSEKIKPGVCYTVTPPNNKLTMENTTTWRCNLLIKMVILHCHQLVFWRVHSRNSTLGSTWNLSLTSWRKKKLLLCSWIFIVNSTGVMMKYQPKEWIIIKENFSKFPTT